jgi:pantothenate synthetase
VAGVMGRVVAAEPLAHLDYAAAVDAVDLTVPPALEPPVVVRLLVAARLGAVRLIDNCDAPLPVPVPAGAGARAAVHE